MYPRELSRELRSVVNLWTSGYFCVNKSSYSILCHVNVCRVATARDNKISMGEISRDSKSQEKKHGRDEPLQQKVRKEAWEGAAATAEDNN